MHGLVRPGRDLIGVGSTWVLAGTNFWGTLASWLAPTILPVLIILNIAAVSIIGVYFYQRMVQ